MPSEYTCSLAKSLNSIILSSFFQSPQLLKKIERDHKILKDASMWQVLVLLREINNYFMGGLENEIFPKRTLIYHWHYSSQAD
jgi:hypothetical protein